MRELEICVETLDGCVAASAGGADRVELCSALDLGGVTPSLGLVRAAVAASSAPVHVLVRPRGGDFVYSAAEFGVMCADVEEALACGAAGVVVGALTAEGEVDRERVGEMVRLAGGRQVTFHRVFDHAANLPEALAALVGLGCGRVLTSGGRPTVMEGLAMLEGLAAQAAGRIRVAAGGGVRLENAGRLVAVAGLDVHASLLPKVEGGGGDPLWGAGRRVLSVEAVRALGRLVHG